MEKQEQVVPRDIRDAADAKFPPLHLKIDDQITIDTNYLPRSVYIDGRLDERSVLTEMDEMMLAWLKNHGANVGSEGLEGVKELLDSVSSGKIPSWMNQQPTLKVEITDHTPNGWYASIPTMAGMGKSASTKEDAFRELMICLAVKVAYDSDLELSGDAFPK